MQKITLPAFIPTHVYSAVDLPPNCEVIHRTFLQDIEFVSISRRDHLITEHGPIAAETALGINQYPVILQSDGSPWREANLYLLVKLFDADQEISRTLEGIAEDLTHFSQVLEINNISFRTFPKFKKLRPTYFYRMRLQQAVEVREIALSTAKRRLRTVIRFYRWLIRNKQIHPENEPWTERVTSHSIIDRFGFESSRQVISTDLKIRIAAGNDPSSDLIDDGGKLRPLPQHEQEWLVDALAALDNTEATLCHLLGLTTGARAQTILTMGHRHFFQELDPGVTEVRLPVGPGTGIDTKHNKQFVLFVPGWLYRKLCAYAHSERYQRRLAKSQYPLQSAPLFITNRGAPYYRSRNEAMVFDANQTIRHHKIGQTIRQYIADQMLPYIRSKHDAPNFTYSLHDLRATFGMNETDNQLKLVKAGKISLHQAREHVRLRMAHDSAVITDRYLNYRIHQEQISHAQTSYEDHIAKLMQLRT